MGGEGLGVTTFMNRIARPPVFAGQSLYFRVFSCVIFRYRVNTGPIFCKYVLFTGHIVIFEFEIRKKFSIPAIKHASISLIFPKVNLQFYIFY